MCWLSGYGWGKLGEVKLPYNPVISTLSDTWRRENRTNTQRPLGKIRCDGSSFKDYFAQINANWHSPGHAGLTVPRYFACSGVVHSQCPEGKWTQLAGQHLGKQSGTGTWSFCHQSPPSSVTEIYQTDECQNNLYSFFIQLFLFFLFYRLKSVLTSGKWQFTIWLFSVFTKTQEGRKHFTSLHTSN